MNFTDYRSFLKDELARRQGRNPNYSSRAFARDLGMSPSHLAEVFSGKHGLSRPAAVKLTQNLKLSSQMTRYFLALVECEHGKTESAKEAAREELSRISKQTEFAIDLDTFRLISDWYHLAILSLIDIAEFQSSPKWIARRLGITVIEAEKALERMERCGLIKLEDGKIKSTKGNTATPAAPVQALKTFHTQMIKKASDAIFDQESSERDITARIFTIRRDQLPEFKALIRQFREKMNEEADRLPAHDDVYALNVQFFSLSSKDGENK